MKLLFAWRSLLHTPRRTLLVAGGYALGVGVMVGLLSVGDALLEQAENKTLFGGGDILLVPAGLNVEVLQIGATSALFYRLENARFLTRQVLRGPRFGADVAEVSPFLTQRLVYLRHRDQVVPALADGSLPDQERAVGGPAPDLPAWRNSIADERWLHPTPAQLYAEIDHFHYPHPDHPEAAQWAEWHYFNWRDEAGLYGYFSFLVGSNPGPPGIQEGEVLTGAVSVQVKQPGQPPQRYLQEIPPPQVEVSEESCDVRLGRNTVRFIADHYQLHVDLIDAATQTPIQADLTVRPAPDLYYPPFTLTARKTFESGYVVPALRAEVEGSLRIGNASLHLNRAVGYHDHNWGYWKEVYWDWGLASSPEFTLIYGRFQHPEVKRRADWSPAFLILSEAARGDLPGGFLALFRPPAITYTGARLQRLPEGGTIRVPEALRMDGNNGDGERLTVTVQLGETIATSPRKGPVASRMFLQMRGRYQVQGTVAGREIGFTAEGFAETFREKKESPR